MQVKLKMLLSAIFFLSLIFITSDVQAAPGRDTNQNGNRAKPQGNAKQAHPSRVGKSRHHQNKASGHRHSLFVQTFARVLDKREILTIQQAWDVAYYINRQQQPRGPHHQRNLKLSEETLYQHEYRQGNTINHQAPGKRP